MKKNFNWYRFLRRANNLARGGHQRMGQAYFNAAYEENSDLLNTIRGGELDPFHDDARLDKFMLWLMKETQPSS